MFTYLYVVASLFLCLVHAKSVLLAPIFKDYIPYFFKDENIIQVSLPVLLSALKTPNFTTETAVNGGYDWTIPYAQATKVVGHRARLRIAYDVPVLKDEDFNYTTALSSLSFGLPKQMIGRNSLPKPMDPSWTVCRHKYVSIKADPKVDPGADSCSFLPPNCLADIRTALTRGWMSANLPVPCAAMPIDPIAESCQEAFGLARGDVNLYDPKNLAEVEVLKAMAGDEESMYTWRVGTGFFGKGDKLPYELALNRTYLIADVYGYSKTVKAGDKRTPEATLTCLSAKAQNAKLGVTDVDSATSNGTSSATGDVQSTTVAAAISSTPTVKATGQISSGNRGPVPLLTNLLK